MAYKINKYDLYERSVQDPEYDIELFNKIYDELTVKKEAQSLREDFCGTFWLSSLWVKQTDQHLAYGIDLSPEPTDYGKEHHYKKLTKDEQARLSIENTDVRNITEKKYDLIVACNFSYFIFKQREELKKYFNSVYQSLDSDSLFIVDHFGGPDNCGDTMEDKTIEHPHLNNFRYEWEQISWNPVTNESVFHINFANKRKGLNTDGAFVYDWRLWSIREVREIMEEVGFAKSYCYWEDDDGEFFTTEEGEDNCANWICMLAGYKK